MMDFGVTNSMFRDPFGYLWMLHQVHREVSFEEKQLLKNICKVYDGISSCH